MRQTKKFSLKSLFGRISFNAHKVYQEVGNGGDWWL